MALKTGEQRKRVVKRTSQGGKVKTSAMNKTEKRTYKKYRGQGR
jgi:hypothetical protein